MQVLALLASLWGFHPLCLIAQDHALNHQALGYPGVDSSPSTEKLQEV